MSTTLDKLTSFAASLPFRLFVLAFGVALFIFFGVTVIANLINPMSWFDFAIAIYITIAGVFAFIYFFTKRLWNLLIVLPVAVYFGVALLLWPPQ
jgi:uncharacterized membrane protein HdeD (DUF308 family)